MWIVWVRIQAGLVLYIVFCTLESCLGWELEALLWCDWWSESIKPDSSISASISAASISFSVCRAYRVASSLTFSSSRRAFSTLSSISLWTYAKLERPAYAFARALGWWRTAWCFWGTRPYWLVVLFFETFFAHCGIFITPFCHGEGRCVCSLRWRRRGRVSCRLARGLYEGPIVFLPAVPFLQLNVTLFFHCTGLGGSEQ